MFPIKGLFRTDPPKSLHSREGFDGHMRISYRARGFHFSTLAIFK